MNITEYQNYHETKSHTNADFPYNTYLCSIPLDFIQVPLHWHEEIEFIVIKKGQGQVSVNLQTRDIAAGDIVFILPGQLHSIRQKDGCSMEYENILFKPSCWCQIAAISVLHSFCSLCCVQNAPSSHSSPPPVPHMRILPLHQPY